MRLIPYQNKEKSRYFIVSTIINDNGAGDGNRTRVVSLEGWSSTIELHLQIIMADQTGIEPAISSVTGRHVNRYTTGPFAIKLVAGEGFEPSTSGLWARRARPDCSTLRFRLLSYNNKDFFNMQVFFLLILFICWYTNTFLIYYCYNSYNHH